MKTLVRWSQSGFLFRDGLAERRSKGDEDFMEKFEAKTHSVCGLVEIVSDAENVASVTLENYEDDDYSHDMIEVKPDTEIEIEAEEMAQTQGRRHKKKTAKKKAEEEFDDPRDMEGDECRS